MEIREKKSILKYFNINMLAPSPSTYFISKKDNVKNRAKISLIEKSKIIIEALDKPRYSDGYFVFQSYTLIFRAFVKIHQNGDSSLYSFNLPEKIETFDQRKYIRLLFEHDERKIIHIFNDNLKKSVRALIADISAGGIGLIIDDEELIPEIGDIITIKTHLSGMDLDTLAKIVNVHKNKIGCIFIERSNKFQIKLNHFVLKEVDWRSETLLVHLKKVYLKRKENEQKKKSNQSYKFDDDFIKSFKQYFITEIKEITGLSLNEKEILFSEHTAPNFLSSVYFSLKFENTEYRAFFYMQDIVVYKIAKFVFNNKSTGLTVNANDILAEIGTKLFDRSKDNNENRQFNISSPSVIQSNKRLMTFFYKSSSIKIVFSTDLGEVTVLLLPERNKRNN